MDFKFKFSFLLPLVVAVILGLLSVEFTNAYSPYQSAHGHPHPYQPSYSSGQPSPSYQYQQSSGNNYKGEGYGTYCSKCGPLPPDCNSSSPAPNDGNPDCTCTPGNFLPGCTLKPCPLQQDKGWACDCSDGNSTGAGLCYDYKCTGADGACETCETFGDSSTGFPPDCTGDSWNHPPANNGPACTCVSGIFPAGCTLPPCTIDGTGGETICICQPNISASTCVRSTCPGSASNSSGI